MQNIIIKSINIQCNNEPMLSSLYRTSWSKSFADLKNIQNSLLNEHKSLKASVKNGSVSAATLKKKKEEFNKSITEFRNYRKWLGSSLKLKMINSICVDSIPNIIGIAGISTLDTLIIDYRADHPNFFIEFKNCDKRTLLENYLNSAHKDCIESKIKGTASLISSIFSDGVIDNYSSANDFLSDTHLIIVYGGDNNIRSSISPQSTSKTSQNLGNNNHQTKRVKVDFSPKTQDKRINSVGDCAQKCGYKPCTKDFFADYIFTNKNAGKPEYGKSKPKSRPCSIFHKSEFMEFVNNGGFDGVDWGIYAQYF